MQSAALACYLMERSTMPSNSNDARLAVLETQAEQQTKDFDEMKDAIKSIATDVSNIKVQMSNHKGFVAGISFAFSMLGGAIAMAVGAVLKKLGL